MKQHMKQQMNWQRYSWRRSIGAELRGVIRLGLATVVAAITMVSPIRGNAQQPAAAPSTLVFDHVTVVDVEHGTLRSNQRVVITGTRIRAMGVAGTGTVPPGAQVVEARGKYLIPGLWDMHVHPGRQAEAAYPLFVTQGVTGIRDAGSPVPLDTLRLWRREILAGTRIGPPRQILSGQSITGPVAKCNRNDPQRRASNQTCVADSADAVRYVDSLKAAGADMIKPRAVTTRALYATIAAEARRVGLPFGGHVGYVTELEASDQGVTIIDHRWGDANCAYDVRNPQLDALAASLASSPLFGGADPAAVKAMLQEVGTDMIKDKGFQSGNPQLASCWKQAAERFRRNGTWFVPTFAETYSHPPRLALANFHFGLLLLAGTDDASGVFPLHNELAFYVAQGLTPLEALQTATLNPAKMLHATDSLGTVASGKLADLVLLDANPLADITNTRQIRAVVANGRYFDRGALDRMTR